MTMMTEIADAVAAAPPRKPVHLRVCWPSEPDPQPGDRLFSAAGRKIYIISRVVVLHAARLSPRARLQIEAYSASVDDFQPGEMELVHPWDRTQPAATDGAWFRPQEAASARNRAAMAKEAAKAQKRAVRLQEAARAPGPVEPIRLPAAVAKGSEDLTPRKLGEVDEAAWPDPEATTNQFQRHAPQVRGYRTACILTRMARRPGSRITEEQIRAADKVRLAWDVARLGYSSGTGLEPSGGSAAGPRLDHGAAAAARNHMSREVNRVLRAIGESRVAMFAAVVIGNQDITAWSRAESERLGCRVEPKVEIGLLLSVLDTLVEYYRAELAFDVMNGNVV